MPVDHHLQIRIEVNRTNPTNRLTNIHKAARSLQVVYYIGHAILETQNSSLDVANVDLNPESAIMLYPRILFPFFSGRRVHTRGASPGTPPDPTMKGRGARRALPRIPRGGGEAHNLMGALPNESKWRAAPMLGQFQVDRTNRLRRGRLLYVTREWKYFH